MNHILSESYIEHMDHTLMFIKASKVQPLKVQTRARTSNNDIPFLPGLIGLVVAEIKFL